MRYLFVCHGCRSSTPHYAELSSLLHQTMRSAALRSSSVTLSPDASERPKADQGHSAPGSGTSPGIPNGRLSGLLSCFGVGRFTRKRPVSDSGSAQPRISFGENIRDRARAEALARITVATNALTATRPLAQFKSLETIARESGLSVAALEQHIRDEMKSFCDSTADGNRRFPDEYQELVDKLFNLFERSRDPSSPEWMKHMRDFDSFIAHFCPPANKGSQSQLIALVKEFVLHRLPPMLQYTSPWNSRSRDRMQPIYNGPRNWVTLPRALVDVQIIEEAQLLVKEGFPKKEELFVHCTGSAAMDNFAKNKAIWSAALDIQNGDKVVTGEYVSKISHLDGQTSISGGESGLENIFASRNGLGSSGYAMQRWFDETPVTFGIGEEKQRAYNDAHHVDRWYNNTSEGVVIGPVASLENVVAISAPKASEARIRGWIDAHCPHAKFVSYGTVKKRGVPLLPPAAGTRESGSRPLALCRCALYRLQAWLPDYH